MTQDKPKGNTYASEFLDFITKITYRVLGLDEHQVLDCLQEGGLALKLSICTLDYTF